MYDVASEMLNAQKYLEIVRARGKEHAELTRVYRNIRQRGLFFAAYAKLYANEGATTPGVDPHDTVDGMSFRRIDTIIEHLKNGTYHWKPVRRTHIEKKHSTKRRPLGVPGWNDKMLQEVLRMVLDAYYEPQFRESSHGFRPNRGCHTALNTIRKTWTGTKWFIETDIKGCFENINHDLVIDILGTRIRDDRFLKLIRGMLQAGYMEDWTYNRTYSGVPQGGIISPLLANIVLHEFDEYVEDILIPEFTNGTRKHPNPEYQRMAGDKRKAKRRKRKWEWEQLTKDMRAIPSYVPNDPHYKRLRYVRYADDSLFGLNGTRHDAERIKEKVGHFLGTHVKVEMSEDKTFITHARSGKARFLGYDIQVDWDNTKVTKSPRGVKRRSVNGNIVLSVPDEVCTQWKAKVFRHGKIWPRPELFNFSDFDIVSHYECELQGLINYYTLAHNVCHTMTTLRYFWFRSLGRTLAGKHRTTLRHIFKTYTRYTANGRKVLTVEVPREGKKSLVATFGKKPIERKTTVTIKDEIREIYSTRNELLTRLEANTCELCGSTEHIQVHHIRKLGDLKKRYKGRKAPPEWVKRMSAMSRKTLVVCRTCHTQIEYGKYDGRKLTK